MLRDQIDRAKRLINGEPIAYFDTTVVLVRQPVSDRARAEILKACGSLNDGPSKAPGYSHRLTLQQPSREALELIEENLDHIVSEFHVALDLPTQNSDDATQLTSIIRRLGIQLRHGKRQSADVQATTGYAAGRPARRNNVTYGDRPSKVTDAPCCHIEFRFKSTRICQKRDVRVCGDLLSYDPLKFIDRDMKLGLIDWKRAFQILRRLNPTKRPVLRQAIIAKTFEALTTPQHRPSFDDPPRFTQLALEVVPQWKDAMFSMSVTELLRACTRAQRACGVSDYNAPFPISTPKHLHHNKLFARSTSLSAPLSLNPYVIPTLPIKYDT